MRSNKLLLLFIFIETLTLFCLGVLGNQVATLLTIPTNILIACTVLGIVAVTTISFLKPTFTDKPSSPIYPTPEHSGQNNSPQTQELASPQPQYSEKQIKRRWFFSIGGALILGIVAMFLHRPLAQVGHSSKWFLMLLIFWITASSPILIIAWRDTTAKHGCFNFLFAGIHTFMVGMMMLFGIILGLLILTGLFGIPDP